MEEDNAAEIDTRLTDRMLDDPLNDPEQIRMSMLALRSLKLTPDGQERLEALNTADLQLGYFRSVAVDLNAARDANPITDPPDMSDDLSAQFSEALGRLDPAVSTNFVVDYISIFSNDIGLSDIDVDGDLTPTLGILTSMLRKDSAVVSDAEHNANIELATSLGKKLPFKAILVKVLLVVNLIFKIITVVRVVATFLLAKSPSKKADMVDATVAVAEHGRDELSASANDQMNSLMTQIVERHRVLENQEAS